MTLHGFSVLSISVVVKRETDLRPTLLVQCHLNGGAQKCTGFHSPNVKVEIDALEEQILQEESMYSRYGMEEQHGYDREGGGGSNIHVHHNSAN